MPTKNLLWHKVAANFLWNLSNLDESVNLMEFQATDAFSNLGRILLLIIIVLLMHNNRSKRRCPIVRHCCKLVAHLWALTFSFGWITGTTSACVVTARSDEPQSSLAARDSLSVRFQVPSKLSSSDSLSYCRHWIPVLFLDVLLPHGLPGGYKSMKVCQLWSEMRITSRTKSVVPRR